MALNHYLGSLGLVRITPDAGPMVVISYPKCGRTWLKVMLGRALCAHYNLPERLSLKCFDPKRLPLRTRARFPRIRFTHAGTGSGCFSELDRLTPPPDSYPERITLIVREPKDVLVSFYHHILHRTRFKDELAASNGAGAEEDSRNWTRREFYDWAGIQTDADGIATLSSYLRSERYGAARLLSFYKVWTDAQSALGDRLHIIRYEEMHASPLRMLSDLFGFLGMPQIPEQHLRTGVDFGAFDHMREMERTNALNSSALKVVDPSTESGFKTREGRIGGHIDHMTPDDIAFVDTLTQSFGCPFYTPRNVPVSHGSA